MKPAKAQLHSAVDSEAEPEVDGRRFRKVAGEALRRVSSQKAAALSMGISEGRLSSKLKDGSLTLKQLETLGADYAVRFALDLLDAFGHVTKSPKERARERLPEIIQEILDMTA